MLHKSLKITREQQAQVISDTLSHFETSISDISDRGNSGMLL